MNNNNQYLEEINQQMQKPIPDQINDLKNEGVKLLELLDSCIAEIDSYPDRFTPDKLTMNGLKRTPAQLQQRRQLCEDLEYCIREDKDLLVTVIDEFVYNLSDKEVEEYIELSDNILGED